LKVPAGTSAEIARHLNESVDVALPSETYYTVKRGDTLPIIARKLQVTRSDLTEANHIGANARLIAGQQLLIPDGLLPAARASRPAVTPVVASSSAVRVKSEYRVRRGDTLSSIAELYSTSLKTLESWNPQLTSSRVTVGQRLTVYK
jgi:LysM repeat protein